MEIPIINENQYRFLFLNEERHYPEFLDKLKFDTSIGIYRHLRDMVDSGTTHDVFRLDLKCEYADSILVDAKTSPGNDLHDIKSYSAKYFNNNPVLKNGKIDNPVLTILCPVVNGLIDLMTIMYVVSHEITHLYDDWMSIKNGKGCLCANETIVKTSEFLEYASTNGNILLKDMAFLSYMSLKTEKQAFLSQTVQELEALGCTMWNYKDIMKKTSLYRNTDISYKNIVKYVRVLTPLQLETINELIVTQYQSANLPKMKLTSFDPDNYRNKLLKWSNGVHKDIMRRYGSVLAYYVDKLKNEFNSGRSMHIY